MKSVFVRRFTGFILFLVPSILFATNVRMQTAFGVIDIQLFDSEAPQTVNNFLNYVNRNDYNDSFLHRSVPGFVIQGGGYGVTPTDSGYSLYAIDTDPPVINEYDPSRSNLRGTIAMAKLGNDPNSATSQWFFNLNNNSANLDDQNGGFTVFGQVIGQGMTVVDTLSALPRVNAGSPFNELPVTEVPTDGALNLEHFVVIQQVSSGESLAEALDSDRVFAYAEAFYTEFLAPAHPLQPTNSGSMEGQGFYYRYYATTQSYLGTANGQLYYLGPVSNNTLLDLGPLSTWLQQAIDAGY